MDNPNPALVQYGVALIVIAVGLSGWLLPPRWNLLQLRRAYARHLSDRTNALIPKVVGTVLIVFGVFVAVMTAIGGPIER